MDEAELKQILTQFGQVQSVKLLSDKETGKRIGVGLIEMPVIDQARSAIAGLDGKEIYGKKVALSEAQETDHDRFASPRREYRSNVQHKETEKDT